MHPPSSTALVFRSLSRSLSLVNRAAPSFLQNNYDACSKRFLSAEAASTGTEQQDMVQSELNEDGKVEGLRTLKQQIKRLRDHAPTSEEEKGRTSHFSQTKGEASAFEPSEPKHLSIPRKYVLPSRKHKIKNSYIKKKFSLPGTSKGSRRKLKSDLKTVSELIQEANGHYDSSLRPESWKEFWGEDELKPKQAEGSFIESDSKKLPAYVRRIEGLIAHSTGDVLEEIEPPAGRAPIASLAHGLDRVLFNPGVHWVQDPRSRVYNFTPFIQTIPDIKDFAFERLSPFIRSSRDTVMRNLVIAKGRRFAGSTSSLSGLLCHIYFLVSQDREVDLSTMSEPFSTAKRTFTPAQRMPTAVVFNERDGVYMIDSDSTDNDDSQWNVLAWMGTMLENFFTLPKTEFTKLLRSASPENTFENQPQAYRYSQSKLFVMRSQLDCVDSRLPVSGVFDIKTRAALPLRLDNYNFKENSGYLINSLHGALNSFDKEYYDLIRSAFLKYSFQARIGNMDGIFLAYHNTARVFGFQYIPLEEMDERLFGDYKYKRRRSEDESTDIGGKEIGWRIFNKCVSLLEVIASEIIECFPGKTITCLAETRPGTGVMHIWVQPVDEASEEIEGEEIPMVNAESEKPIIQLDVTARSFLGGVHAATSDAILYSRKPWTVHWTVSRSSLPEKTIRQHLAAAEKRKFIPKAFPAGVNADNLKEFFENLGFGNPEFPPDATRFIAPHPSIRFLRRISRAGQLETERLKLQDELKGVHIWQPAVSADSDAVPLSTDRTATVEQRDASELSNSEAVQT